VKCLVRTWEKEIIVLFVVYEKMEKRKRELEEVEPGIYRDINYMMNCI
jgi:hypothetical protein